jgi:O2-independent ubiquinone biosynthesis protein UbiV
MELTVGPSFFLWSPERWTAVYDAVAAAPVDRVVLGEAVCSKRLPFVEERMAETIDKLSAAGKAVTLTTLALVTLPRERKATAALVEAGAEIEVNDLTALAYLPEGAAFSVSPLVNVYNESTLAWLARRGAVRVCLPPELPLEAVAALARAGAALGVAIEVWGHGRVPLAISGRCYHARLHGRGKDTCRFVCEDDPDGLEVRTLDDAPFLAMNGVQTLSDSYACAANQIDELRAAGVSSLRLSPQSQDFAEVCASWRRLLEGEIAADAAVETFRQSALSPRLSDGFLDGGRGAVWASPSP